LAINERWTADDIDKLTKAYHAGVSDLEIASLLDRTVGSIEVKRSRLDLAVPFPRRVYRDWIKVGCPKSMADIIADVSKRTGVPVHDIKGPSRFRSIVRARHMFMTEAYETGRFSLPQIGRFLGRDHTTVLHGIRQHKSRQTYDVHNYAVPLADL